MISDLITGWDYLNIGSNGFAQFGEDNYSTKAKVEMKILLELVQKSFTIPEEFSNHCYFKIMKCPYDDGHYHELVLRYDRRLIDDVWGSSDDVDLTDRHSRFYEWFCDVESWDMETELITETIKNAYAESLDIDNGEHLRVAV